MNKTSLFDRYLSSDELGEALQHLRELRPGWMTVEELARSRQGRPLWVATLTDPSTGDPETKPAMYVDANIHAAEIAGSAVALHLIHTLLTHADEPATRALLQRVTFYVLPRIAVDAVEWTLSGGAWLRSSPHSWPSADPVRGLVGKDLDGDGHIRTLRIEDPAGGWAPHPEEPRLMVPRRFDDDQGPFYRLLVEGEFVGDADPRLLEEARNPFRMDFNRNFPAHWKLEKDQPGAGPHPLSEPETDAMARFIVSHPNIAAIQALHTGIEVTVPPEGVKAFREFPDGDRALYVGLGERARELTGWPFHSLMALGYSDCPGDFSEWAYAHRGIASLVVELWSLPGRAGIPLAEHLAARQDKAHTWPDVELKCLRWAEEHIGQGAYKGWEPFEHPQLGRVEIGGWPRELWWSPPPGPHLTSLCERATALILSQARMLPALRVASAQAQQDASGLYHVELILENAGHLPTWLTAQGKRSQVVDPGYVELKPGQGQSLAHGHAWLKGKWLDGRGDRALYEWWLRAPAEAEAQVKLHVHIPQGGVFDVDVTLPR